MNRRHFIHQSIAALCGLNTFSFGQSSAISLDSMIGQMIMVGFHGTYVNQYHSIVHTIQNQSIGGVILFDYNVATQRYNRNIKSPTQVKKLIDDLQSFSQIPLFIAVDYEGGRVNRLKKRSGFYDVPSAKKVGLLNSEQYTTVHTDRMAGTLSNLGFNLNFAPVVDLNINPENPVIGSIGRSFSSDPEIVIKHARIWIETFRNHQILSVIKHFPGHGSSKTDSHLGMVDITDTWQKIEFLPYLKLISEHNVDAVMTAHVFHKGMEPHWPATLSYPIITGLLRDKLNFKGLVISDDMQMNAISQHYGFSESILQAINAGVDILLFANNGTDDKSNIARKAIRIIKDYVQQGQISIDRIEASYQRIMLAKKKYISIHQRH